MLVFESMIAQAAIDAGMKTPSPELMDAEEGGESWKPEDYPHFYCFCSLQLGRSMARPGQHWDNAKVIAKIPEERLKTMTLGDFVNAGVEVH